MLLKMVKKEAGKKALKTFNLDSDVYGEFSEHCKENGISMSRKVENFIREELEQIKSGGRVNVKRFTKVLSKKDLDGQGHNFQKYC
jgi:hypothetical protein